MNNVLTGEELMRTLRTNIFPHRMVLEDRIQVWRFIVNKKELDLSIVDSSIIIFMAYHDVGSLVTFVCRKEICENEVLKGRVLQIANKHNELGTPGFSYELLRRMEFLVLKNTLMDKNAKPVKRRAL